MNDTPVEIDLTEEDPAVIFNYNGGKIRISISKFFHWVGQELVKHGVHHVETCYYEQFPLFQVAFASESSMKGFLDAIDPIVKNCLELRISEGIAKEVTLLNLPTSHVEVKMSCKLFLVIPERQKRTATTIHPVTRDNCLFHISNWKESELFDFLSLFSQHKNQGMCSVLLCYCSGI